MKKVSSTFISIIICLVCTLSYSQESARTQDESGKVRIFTLANGFSLFAKEDRTSALVRIEFVAKAGFSSQSPSDAGFFPLYANLFLSSAKNTKTDDTDMSQFISSCNADSSTFIVNSTSSNVEKLLSKLSDCVLHSKFSDSSIKREYEAMKTQVNEYNASVTGFINSAIDSRVFSDSPWKQDSGIYPSLFTNYKIAEVRTILSNIGNNFYTPDNCAIFISGNISTDDAYRLVEKYFSEWSGIVSVSASSSLTMSSTGNGSFEQTKKRQRKFVLADDSFSKELTQIVVQYTSLSQSQADILAASFTGAQSPYKAAILKEPSLAVRSKDYLTAASAQKNGSSRFILQALMEAPYSFAPNNSKDARLPDACEQAELFIKTAAQAANLSRSDFIYAQNLISSKYKSETGSSSESMSLLADYWALDSSPSAKKRYGDFYTRFLNLVYNAQNQSESTTAAAIQNESPFVFVLVNTDVYEKQKASFEKEGYILVTTKNASWYKDEIVRKSVYDSEQQIASTQNEIQNAAPQLSDAQLFYNANKPLFFSTTLSNSIPVVIKQNPQSQTALISIAISGGELSSPDTERYLRTTLINAFARNIQRYIDTLRQQNTFYGETKIAAWTEDTASYITISCMADDIPQALLATTNAILYGDVEPVIADSLVAEQKNQWLLKSANLLYQMSSSALGTIYSGTSFEKLFDADTSILKNTKYNSFPREYTKLLDASLYSIVITGNTDPKKITSYAQNSIGLLQQQTERTVLVPEMPTFTKMTRTVRLRHTYTTDIPADEAGERPEILVPTTDFYDPVQFWFEPPSSIQEIPLFNALLYELQNRMQKECGPAIPCSVQTATPILHIGCIQGEKILHTASFLAAYKKVLRSLLTDLQKDSGTLSSSISSLWISQTLDKTLSNEGTASLIQRGLSVSNPELYLDEYLTISQADNSKYRTVLEQYFPEDPVFKVYSADSKR